MTVLFMVSVFFLYYHFFEVFTEVLSSSPKFLAYPYNQYCELYIW